MGFNFSSSLGMDRVAGKYTGVRDEGDREKHKKGELNCVGFFKRFSKCLERERERGGKETTQTNLYWFLS